MASAGITLGGARYFGQLSPTELRDLERNALRASDEQMAKAAAQLQDAFQGHYYAWFGGWALKLRGSRRKTRDLDLLVLADNVGQVRAILAPCAWAILSYYEITGSIQERMFVDIGEGGQVVGVDIVLSGQLNTPCLGDDGSIELIEPRFETPQGDQVPVIDLTWQVEGKLGTWMSRKKLSDYEDLEFLCRTYGSSISEWSENLPKAWRHEFYGVFKASVEDEAAREDIKRTLSLT
ncbi:uncharacterized protein B0J16DRAFT_417797 [Fusarium flagelliforme]|uniref:uncharacterized protein n=1 Tax=Fusarium flagelliforme TaxID=2675880 RepID=UPI001E8CBFE5|nr:uncharacterized protein B0J16DRAFT_417797 [Fusarium flagelliforme]KAH7174261.1 hypothetical protein B0J16DRAFT_417797 [Fusarium flagelliforme]